MSAATITKTLLSNDVISEAKPASSGGETNTASGALDYTVRTMEPFGVRIELSNFNEVKELNDNAFKEVLKEQMELRGLVLITGLLPGEEGGFTPRVMEELMKEFGSAPISFKGVPMDPDEDGVEGANESVIAGHESIRVLGNSKDASGRPTALLANVGYCFHQDSTPPFDCTTALYCEKSPPFGAETLFAKTSTMYSNLNDDQKKFLEEATAVWSNVTTAGGPAALDAAYGVRMNATGTRRIREAHRRRKDWKMNERKRKCWAVDDRTGEKLLWTQALSFDKFENMDGKESQDKLDDIMRTALRPTAIGQLDSDLQTVSPTYFDKNVVMPVSWQPGMFSLMNAH